MDYSCIFSTDKSRCANDKTWEFNGIICKEHLREVYGLETHVHQITTETETTCVGPFLISKEHNSFKPKEVIFPDRDFFDKTIRPDKNSYQAGEYEFKLNSNIDSYVHDLGINKKPENIVSSRYQLEIIRNLSVPDVSKVNLGNDDQKEGFSNFLVQIRTRIGGMNQKIESSKMREHFKNITVVTASGEKEVLDKSTNISLFYKLLLSRCHFDVHNTPIVNSFSETLTFNVSLKLGVGFFATEKIPNPIPLIISGDQQGNQLFYYLTTAVYKRETKGIRIDPKRYPHNRNILGSLSGASDYCKF